MLASREDRSSLPSHMCSNETVYHVHDHSRLHCREQHHHETAIDIKVHQPDGKEAEKRSCFGPLLPVREECLLALVIQPSFVAEGLNSSTARKHKMKSSLKGLSIIGRSGS